MSWWKRALGVVIGGVGTYLAIHWFNAWELQEPVILALSGGMAVAGYAFGPKVWDALVHFV